MIFAVTCNAYIQIRSFNLSFPDRISFLKDTCSSLSTFRSVWGLQAGLAESLLGKPWLLLIVGRGKECISPVQDVWWLYL